MKCWIVVPDQPAAEHRDAVVAMLADFNARSGFPVDTEPVAVLLKDDQGRTIGGLWGKTSFGWLYVEFLVVPDSLRGHSPLVSDCRWRRAVFSASREGRSEQHRSRTIGKERPKAPTRCLA